LNLDGVQISVNLLLNSSTVDISNGFSSSFLSNSSCSSAVSHVFLYVHSTTNLVGSIQLFNSSWYIAWSSHFN
jgi:hypothetical protein